MSTGTWPGAARTFEEEPVMAGASLLGAESTSMTPPAPPVSPAVTSPGPTLPPVLPGRERPTPTRAVSVGGLTTRSARGVRGRPCLGRNPS